MPDGNKKRSKKKKKKRKKKKDMDIPKELDALYEKVVAEGGVPWNDSEGYDSPHDLAWSLRDMTETGSGVDYVTSVARKTGGAAFLVKFKTGKRLRVDVTAAEPDPRFYPEEGEPDEREKQDFDEAFEEEK